MRIKWSIRGEGIFELPDDLTQDEIEDEVSYILEDEARLLDPVWEIVPDAPKAEAKP